MTIWCVGAGAIGGTIAARLTRAGKAPLVVDANADHVMRLRSPGIEVGGIDDGSLTPLDAVTPPEAMSRDDECRLVLLAVRSSATEAALSPVIDRLCGDVVSLQNGLNEDRIASLVGSDRTIGCVVGYGATWIGPGHVELDEDGDLRIGRLDGSIDDRLNFARDVLDTAFPTSTTTNVLGALWGKMLVNSMTVLGALGGMRLGELLADDDRRRMVAELLAEGVDVAVASDVRLPNVLGNVDADVVAARASGWAHAMDAALRFVGEHFGRVRSVTWRDFELGRPTEIDAVTGEIVRRGRTLGVPVPLNERADAMLREIEAGDREIDVSNLADLVRHVA